MAKIRPGVGRPLAGVTLRGPVGWDPWIALAQGLALQALRDLYDQDYMRIFETLLWWIDENGGVFILRSVGVDTDPNGVFESILLRGRNVKQIHFSVGRTPARDGIDEQ